MDNIRFLEVIKSAFETFLITGSNSTGKLKVLHGAIAQDLHVKLGNDYIVHSLGYEDDKEMNVPGYYMNKKVDIAIEKKGEFLGAVGVKFAMQNYTQNSNNYFENMLGETANIKMIGKPYYQIFILSSKAPYYKDTGEFVKFENISQHYIEKYIKLSEENNGELAHVPNKILFYFVDFSNYPENISNKEEYNNFYSNPSNYDITINNAIYNFDTNVIYNDYETFVNHIVDAFKSIE